MNLRRTTFKIPVLLLGIMFVCCPLVLAQPTLSYTIVKGDEIDLSKLSVIGKKVLRKPDHWKIGRSEHFVVFAGDLRELSDTVEEAEYTYRCINRWLGLEKPDPEVMYLVMIDDENNWEKTIRGHGLRHDSLALQIERELYLKNDSRKNIRPDRIAHEVVHVRLAESLELPLPLCLEEGLACHVGWQCAVEFSNFKSVTLTRSEPTIAKSDLFSLPELLAVKAYPANDRKARAFYRQTEELIRVLESRLGEEKFPDIIRGMTTNEVDPLLRFREACRLDEQQMNDVMTEVSQRCLLPWMP